MRSFSILFAGFALQRATAYVVDPPGTAAPGAPDDCSGWVQDSYGLTCDSIEATYGVSAADFESWNPTVSLLGNGCTLIQGLYYCIAVDPAALSSSSTTTSTTTSSTITSLVTTSSTTTSSTSNSFTTTSTTHTFTISATACATGNSGLVSPTPSSAVGHKLINLLVSYSSGANVLSLAACNAACLSTAGCTNLYFAPNQYCNLHAGAETHVASPGSIYTFYDANCFICPSPCSLASSPPSGAVCNIGAYSNGGTTIISYSAGQYVESVEACGEICLQTSGCTNLYFDEGVYCNLHSGTETHNPDSTSPYIFYDSECFTCPPVETTCSLISPQPSGAVCDVVAYSNGGTTIISYNSGLYITSLLACAQICLDTSGCTNLYFDPGTYCNLHSGTETHNPDPTSPYIFYDSNCFECATTA
ncbi:hypothetical protein BX600DRAFT_497018 [Xylariales sp. PMI_506]|nr:hypothetical protein BX600DRAFT_497018 [Xylariales sp. PMI_506]